jgi:NADPH:quinone reductase-like Zn-dependent oxidoreductase
MSQMKAAVLVKHGEADTAFDIRSVERPKRAEHQLLIKTEAFGLNYADVMARRGLYRDAPPMPAILGYDLVGEVVEAPEESAHLIGKRVAAMSRFGAYAEYVVSMPRAIFEVPDHFDAAQACALGTQYCTAWHAAFQATTMHPGDTVLIHAAAGGVGTAFIQLAKWKGCRIVGLAGSDEKVEALLHDGVDLAINYRKHDYAAEIRRHLGKRPIDLSFNSVAGTTFKKDMQLLRPGGRLVLFGASQRSGKRLGFLSDLKLLWDMGRVIPIFLVAGSRSVIGVNVLRIADHRPDILADAATQLNRLLAEGVLTSKSGGVFPIEQLAEAHSRLERGASTGKLAVKW